MFLHGYHVAFSLQVISLKIVFLSCIAGGFHKSKIVVNQAHYLRTCGIFTHCF